jgi:selenocysteine lyase/cysteine desulfurase
MTRRREFLARSAGALGAIATLPQAAAAERLTERLGAQMFDTAWLDLELSERRTSEDSVRLAEDERFWARVRDAYALAPDVINLDHGWTNPAPRAAVDALARGARALEALPAEYLPSTWETVGDTKVRQALAEAMRVPPAEIALVRNATEALATVLLGLPLRAGDEILCSTHDYYATLDALEQRRARDGAVLRMLRPPAPAPSFDALAAMYESALSPRTKLVLLTHPSNRTGQLLPVRRIADAAHRVGAEVVVDGAQSLGLLDDPVNALGCDYYGASGHKWLGLPVGYGVLWMRPEHTAKVWPLLPPGASAKGIKRFEWIGTSAEYLSPAALPALALHRSLGADRKMERLRHLTRYWRTRLSTALPEARFYTIPDSAMSAALCTVSIPGLDPLAAQKRLRTRDGILVQAFVDGPSDGERRADVSGLRVSPNVYTTPAELDRFVAALVRAVRANRP